MLRVPPSTTRTDTLFPDTRLFRSSQIGTRDQRADRAKVTVGTGGLSGGADTKLAEGATVGIGVGYGGDESIIGGGAARVHSRTTIVAGYGSFEPVADAFVDVLLAHGDLDFHKIGRAHV